MPRRRWSGPPPLLLLTTVVLYGVAVLSSGADVSTPTAGDLARLASSEPSATPETTPTETPTSTPTSTPSSTETSTASADVPESTGATESPSAPAEEEPTESETAEPTTSATAQPRKTPSRRIGLVSFNAYKQLSLEQTVQDARTLARKDWVDIIGWQEAYRMGQVRNQLSKLGWGTAWAAGGSEELAVSWRKEQFVFVRADRRRVAPGVDPSTDHPVSDRYVLRVVLRDRATGHNVSILTTHLPQAIENEDQPGRWRSTPNAERARSQLSAFARAFDNSPGRWVLGTGDMNFDVSNERRVEPHRGPTRTLRGHATSSYQALGGKGLPVTHPVSGRNIDYVYAATPDVRQERVEFLKHLTVDGLHSDHRPLLARFKLS
ncbi:hypothetical protein KUV85_00885 [Nocardioides panacisoli]|uniref:hypothetical protein n=1 Tax=Nocardioides panacisoli TaxID=627624 RepID=UPI001C62B50B|nr:hypothetical protein [Nocardioides panacisoli]QYJ04269.1 hypothetical protein KUV85_00885 [Nocardioides panacisoli]